MHEKVRAYLEYQKSKSTKESIEQKEAFLIELGLFEKEYNPNDYFDSKYPRFDSDLEKYYRHVPIEVSDEEYEEIKKYASIKDDSSIQVDSKTNVIATILRVFAWMTCLCGFILGVIAGKVSSYEFSFSAALTLWIEAFVQGTMLYGFAEIIKLLQELKDK